MNAKKNIGAKRGSDRRKKNIFKKTEHSSENYGRRHTRYQTDLFRRTRREKTARRRLSGPSTAAISPCRGQPPAQCYHLANSSFVRRRRRVTRAPTRRVRVSPTKAIRLRGPHNTYNNIPRPEICKLISRILFYCQIE
jgi:hypothetical protein